MTMNPTQADATARLAELLGLPETATLDECVEALETRGDIRTVRAETAEALDRMLHRIVTKGVRQLTESGEVVVVDPPAAYLRIARDRAKDLGMGTVLKPGTAAGNLLDEAMRRGISYRGKRFPLDPVDNDETMEA